MKKLKRQEKNPTHVRFGQFLREKRLLSSFRGFSGKGG